MLRVTCVVTYNFDCLAVHLYHKGWYLASLTHAMVFLGLFKHLPISCSKLREIIVHFEPVSTNAVTHTPSIFIFKQGDRPTTCAVLLVVTVFTPARLLVEA